MKMQIGKWGNSLAVRLPRELILKHGLKEGDVIDARAFDRAIGEESMTREQALERIKALRRPLPADWKFDRDEANAR